MNNKLDKTGKSIFGFLAILLVATCVCSAAWLAGKYYLSRRVQTAQFTQVPTEVAPSAALTLSPATSATTEASTSPTAQVRTTATKTPGSDLAAKPDLESLPAASATPEEAAQETLRTLENTLVPINDLTELAVRLSDKPGLFFLPTPIPGVYQVGDEQLFWTLNVDSDQKFQTPATLVYINDRVYFWVEDGLRVNQQALQKLADTFAQKIYPTDRQFFGSEWTPGIDADPRLHILLTSNVGSTVAGYFSSTDEYPTQINRFSNAHEMFLLNADTIQLDSPFTFGVLAHEFQHMIHWNEDRNEETWMNEGFADLAAFLNGYSIGGVDTIYAQNTDIQLTDWPPKPQADHYGAAFLFLTYFLDRFGEKATQAVVSNPANGLVSIDQVLADEAVKDPLTGKLIGADDVFIDWAVANYLQDSRVGDGRYAYHNYPTAPKASDAEIIKICPVEPVERQVHQYGVDYIHIRCPGEYRLRFNGPDQVNILPTSPHSGAYSFWSNFGDESDMTLSHSFDFSNVSGPLTLKFWTWYDIEQGYDRVYLLASQDNGENWQILDTPSGSTEDRSGNSYGEAYTGKSGGGPNDPQWIQESVDLSSLAGKQVLLRFEYVTDSAVNGSGFLIDDVAIPEISYTTNFELDNGGWDAQGFVRFQNTLPQTYRIAVINKGRPDQVNFYSLDGDNSLEIPIHIVGDVKDVILVVSGTTRITRQEANYSYQILP